MSTSLPDPAPPPTQAAPSTQAAPPDPATPPPTRPRYRIPDRSLRAMAFTLPRPGDDEPESAWQDELEAAFDQLDALDPHNPIEAILALQVIGAAAGAQDALRLAMEPGASAAQALRQRASASAMTRSVTTAIRLLSQRHKLHVGPPRDWGDAVADLSAAWRQSPARPPESARTGKTADHTPETVVRYYDEIDDEELAIATEQARRRVAGEPALPRKPGEPIVIYAHKPDDYIHKFRPDPKSWRKYPGYENMTMAERREFFGYTYTGPNGPPEALTPASRDLMLAEMARQEEIEAALDAEYGPRLSPSP